jgi:transcriptional regulator NrdR family protein
MLAKPKFCCRECGEYESEVTDTRPDDVGAAIYRRRRCLHCGYKFTTTEKIEGPQSGIPRGDRNSTCVSLPN